MVNYMWGKDVADALLASDDAPKLDDAWARGAVRFYGEGLSPDARPTWMIAAPSDPYDFAASPADIERAIQYRRDRLTMRKAVAS